MPVKTDSAIIFAPVGWLVPKALQSLRKGGTLALAGIYMTDMPAMNYEQCVFYERDIHSVTANTREDGRGPVGRGGEDTHPPAHDDPIRWRRPIGRCRT